MTINRPAADNQGLFGVTEGALLNRIKVLVFTLTGANRCGGVVGYAMNGSEVRDSLSKGEVTAVSRSGGLVGALMWGSRIVRCFSAATVTGSDNRIGGLAGQSWSDNETCIVLESAAVGDVTGQDIVGGLVGLTRRSEINDSRASGNVTGLGSIGGLIGHARSSEIRGSRASGNVTGEDRIVGGLLGQNMSEVFYRIQVELP